MTLRPVYVVATAAVTPFGLSSLALARGLAGAVVAAPSSVLAASYPAQPALGVAPIPPSLDPVPAKTRKTMARAAYLAAVALHALLDTAPRDALGYFLGVGASGGAMADFEAIMAATLGDRLRGDSPAPSHANSGAPREHLDSLDLERFGTVGIAACHPLLAFQLMNNFTMCHGAILEGVTGPSSAFFSRGAGTVAALIEAHAAVAGGDCDRAIAGGADSALHPVTWLEHQRLADVPVRLPASEGVGLLMLSATAPTSGPAIVIEVAAQVTRADDPAAHVARLVLGVGRPCDVIVVGADDAGQRDALVAAATGTDPDSVSVISLDGLGTCLAATPALGWVAAIEALQAGARRAAVVTLDGVGDLAVVVLARLLGAPA